MPAGLAPLDLSLWARADSFAQRPRGPGRRCARSTPGRWEGRWWRKDARATTRQGRGDCGASAILSPSPYLRPRGRAHHPPPAIEREGLLLFAAFAAFKFPWCLQLLPPPCFCYLLTPQGCGRWVGKMRLYSLSELPPPLPRPHQNGRRLLGRHHHQHHHHYSSLSLLSPRPVLSRETVTEGWKSREFACWRRALSAARGRLGVVVRRESQRFLLGGRASLPFSLGAAAGAALRLPTWTSSLLFYSLPR